MVEGGLSNTDLGKLIPAACFVTDLGTVVTLGVLFASFNVTFSVTAPSVIYLIIGIGGFFGANTHYLRGGWIEEDPT
jgi:hypothetical protein